jgi:hypothetical protein
MNRPTPEVDDAVAQRIERREQHIALLEHQLREQASPARRFSGGRWVVTALFLAAGVASAQLVTFTANTPARASEINGNFSQLQSWLEAKVGSVASPDITASGALRVTGPAALDGGVTTPNLTATKAAVQRYAPPYGTLSNAPADVGAGGATIVNDNGTRRRLVIVGNNLNGTSHEVEVQDNLYVSGKTDIGLQKVEFYANDRAYATCPSGTRLVGGGGRCTDATECHLKINAPESDTQWQAQCEGPSRTKENCIAYAFCARIL